MSPPNSWSVRFSSRYDATHPSIRPRTSAFGRVSVCDASSRKFFQLFEELCPTLSVVHVELAGDIDECLLFVGIDSAGKIHGLRRGACDGLWSRLTGQAILPHRSRGSPVQWREATDREALPESTPWWGAFRTTISVSSRPWLRSGTALGQPARCGVPARVRYHRPPKRRKSRATT